MFGRRNRQRPATKGEVLFAGVFMTAIGGLLSFAVIAGEPAPGAPAIALIAATVMALLGFGCGLWLLATALRMFTRDAP